MNISLNIERQMKLEALSKHTRWAYGDYKWITPETQAKMILDLLDSVELSTQEAWMAQERVKESEKTLAYQKDSDADVS